MKIDPVSMLKLIKRASTVLMTRVVFTEATIVCAAARPPLAIAQVAIKLSNEAAIRYSAVLREGSGRMRLKIRACLQ